MIASIVIHPARFAILVSLALISTRPGLVARAEPGGDPRTASLRIEHALRASVKLYGASLGREHGYGTGVLVSSDGQIVTALSLFVRSGSVRAVLDDGRVFRARFVRADEHRQLALLQIPAAGLPFLKPSKTDHLDLGDAIVAVGNWYKVADGEERVSVTKGILSLKANLEAKRLAQDFPYGGPALFYDAITSNPGAPGGAVLDAEGRFVGLIGKIVESTHTNTRINYAVPSEELMAFLGERPLPRTAATQSAQPSGDDVTPRVRPYIGIRLSKLGYRHVSAYVDRVRPDSPAAKAGVRPDDLILAVDGKRITDAESYRRVAAKLVPDQTVRFDLKRGTQIIQVDLTIGAVP